MGQLDQEQVKESLESVGNDGGGIAESLSDLLDSLTDEEQDVLLSELSNEEIKHLSVLETTGDELTNEFIGSFRQMKVSHNRKGRKELIEVADAISAIFEAQEGGKLSGMKDKLGL